MELLLGVGITSVSKEYHPPSILNGKHSEHLFELEHPPIDKASPSTRIVFCPVESAGKIAGKEAAGKTGYRGRPFECRFLNKPL